MIRRIRYIFRRLRPWKRFMHQAALLTVTAIAPDAVARPLARAPNTLSAPKPAVLRLKQRRAWRAPSTRASRARARQRKLHALEHRRLPVGELADRKAAEIEP